MRRVSNSVATGLAGQLALVASGVILARSLGVHDRGRLAVLVLTVSLVSQIATMGVPTALTYAMARGERVGWGIKSVGGLISLQLTAGLAIEAIALLAIEHRWHGIGGAPIVSALALTLAGMLQQYGLAVLQGARRFRAFNICRTLPAAGFSALAGVTVLFIHIDLHLSITLLALTGVASAVVTITTVFARPLERYNETTKVRKLLRFGARALLGSSSPVETLRLDQAVVGLFLSATSLGLYVVAAAFTNLPRFVAQSVGMVAYPEVAATQAKSEARRKVHGFLAIGTGLVLLIAVPLELTAGWLIRFFFGAEFAGATDACRILIGAAALVGIRRVLSDSLNGLGKPQLGSYAEVVSWIALILTLPVGAVFGGLAGVAASLLISAAGSLAFLAATGLGRSARASRYRRDEGGPLRVVRHAFADPFSKGIVFWIGAPTLAVVGGVALTVSPAGGPFMTTAALCSFALAAAIIATRSLRTLGSILIVAGAATLAMTGVRITSWMALSDLFFLMAAIALIPSAFLRSNPSSEVRRAQTVGVALIVVGGLIASFVAEDWRDSNLNFVKLVIASALILLLVTAWGPTPTDLRRITLAWVGSSTVSALWAMLEPTPLFGRPSGLAGHPNALALTCVLALGPALLFIAEGRSWRRLLAISATSVLAWGIVLSGSRAGALGGATVLLLAFGLYARRSIVVIGLAAGVIAALLLGGLQPNLPRVNAISRLVNYNSSAVYESDAERSAALKDSISTISGHPLTGVGFANAKAAHNIYLQAWQSGGILALLGFLMIACATLKPLRVITRRYGGDQRGDMVALGISLGFAGYLVAGLFQNALWERYVWFMPALVAAAWPVRSAWRAWDSQSERASARGATINRVPYGEVSG